MVLKYYKKINIIFVPSSNVKDVNSVLEVTVFDEDPDYKVEFLGKVAIPLLSINNGVQKWYSLKNKKLTSRAKGNNPRILLEMRLVWNPVSLLNSPHRVPLVA